MQNAKIQTNTHPLASLEDKNNPWKIIEDKEKNALTNVETHTRYLNENESAIAKLQAENTNLRETIQLNQNLYDLILKQKQETVEAGADLAKARARISKLPPELQAIANQLGGDEPEPPTDPEPNQQAETSTEQTLDEMVAEAKAEPESEPKPKRPPVASRQNNIDAAIDNILPTEEKKDSGSTDSTSTSASDNADGESGNGDSNGSAIAETEKKPETEQPSAGQQSEGSPVAVEPSYRENGLIFLDMEKADTVKKCNGYTVTFQEAKDYKLNKKDYTGITLKLVGEGTTSLGREIHCGFESGSSEYFIVCKDTTGKQYKDSTKSKREAMPREFAAHRQAAIAWMNCNFPLTSSKWEGQVVYTTPNPVKQSETQPANVAAAPSK